ncbi:hypothetical protein Sango_0652300 [Sesamum angolense]|uniref:Uncharacterized protein n=1 Tax=Sesamum angolense TaxID=2727404 RepID=A0AAE2C2E4_9LAMI|nr:hypothetical protein Sango_0652300 [Sesamum angolense]
MDLARKMVFNAAGPVFGSSNYNQDGAPNIVRGRVLLMPGLVHILVGAPMIMSLSWQIDFTMYKFTRERNSNRKKAPCDILRYMLTTPSLQRFYASEATAEQMMWHANHPTEEGSMCHSSNDRTCSDFAAEPRNVRRGLCTNGFLLGNPYLGSEQWFFLFFTARAYMLCHCPTCSMLHVFILVVSVAVRTVDSTIKSITSQYMTLESLVSFEMVRALRVCGHNDWLSRKLLKEIVWIDPGKCKRKRIVCT